MIYSVLPCLGSGIRRGLAPGAEPLDQGLDQEDSSPTADVSLHTAFQKVAPTGGSHRVGGNQDGMTLTELEAEAKRVRCMAADAYELYTCIQLLLSALQFEFDDGKEEIRRALLLSAL